MIKLKELQEIIGYSYKNEDYLIEALTHSSYANENKKKNKKYNERLEFLGDSVLGIIISNYLYKDQEDLPEGDLTKIRANIVCEESLKEAADTIKLGKYLFLGKGEEITGGRERTSIIADTFEALIGSIYLDGGLDAATTFVYKVMDTIIVDAVEGRIFRDYKTQLQEMLQSRTDEKISYDVVEEKGPDHDKKFVMEVRLGKKVLGSGEGKSKKEAEQKAAKKSNYGDD